ncbi:MAG: nuclear transport factor 2 family protein [Spirosomataceae bacterium]
MKKLFFIALLMGVLVGKTVAQNAETNKKALREIYNALEKKDYATFGAHLSPNAVDYAAGPEPTRGRDAVVASIKGIFDALSDIKITVEDIAVSGNKYYVKNTLMAKHTGTMFGMVPATNRSVSWSDVDILELDNNGQCIAHWANNPNGLLEQIGFLALANPNTSIVMQAYEKFGKGDIPSILAMCADNVVWDVLDNPASSVARVYTGKQEVGVFFKSLMGALQIVKFEPLRFMADGDDVTAYINTEYKMTGSNQLYKTTLVHHIVIQNGKISSFKEISDKPQEITMAKK